MKKFVFIFMFLFFICFVSCIQITEIEMNPSGTDAGNEWIEIYCKEKTDLKNYSLKDNKGKEITLEGTCEDYFIYNFAKLWLTNKDYKLFLYLGSDLIQETSLLKDERDDSKTWQICGSSWSFEENSKGSKNNCLDEKSSEDVTKEETKKEETQKIIEPQEEEIVIVETPKNITLNTINLEPKDIKNQNDKGFIEVKPIQKNTWIIYGFFGFSLVIGLLLITRRKKYIEDEFRE